MSQQKHYVALAASQQEHPAQERRGESKVK